MKQLLHNRAVTAVVAGAASVGLFMGGMAYAGGKGTPPVKISGGAQVQSKVVTSADIWSPDNFNAWENVPGARVTVSVPAGKTRLITARFSAESYCSIVAVDDTWCSIRIMARRAGGSAVELHPQAGDNFAFDAADGEPYEGNSLSRSIKLAQGGNWDVWVQGLAYTEAKPSGYMLLDDWHLEVEVSK